MELQYKIVTLITTALILLLMLAEKNIRRSDKATMGSDSSPLQSQHRQELARILTSSIFRASHTARRLLDYIVTHSLNEDTAEMKEFTIGVEVLGRRPDFDPKVDTIVRVQIHRLRQKLTEYYETEGCANPVRISIPRGSYHAEFAVAPAPSVGEGTGAANAIGLGNARFDPPPEHPPSFAEAQTSDQRTVPSGPDGERHEKSTLPRLSIERWRKWGWPIFSLLLACAGVIAGYLIASRSGSQIAVQQNGPVERLWLQMLANDPNPIIGYATDVHLLDESNDMFSFGSGAVGRRGAIVEPHVAQQFAVNPDLVSRAGPLYYDDGYAGTGELESVATLVSLLRDLGMRPVVKRGEDVTTDDLRNHNVIFLGSEFLSRTIDDLPTHGDFHFNGDGKGVWSLKIVNQHPQQGEANLYVTERTKDTGTVVTDYALISFQPGLSPSRHVIVLGGLDTTGTAGATGLATSQVGAEKLLHEIDAHNAGGKRPFFQAVVQCLIKNGNEVSSAKPVAIHSMPWKDE